MATTTAKSESQSTDVELPDEQFDESGGLHRVAEHTIEEGVVEGVIVDLEPETCVVTVKKLTDGEKFQEDLEVPDSWTTDNNFVHLVESHGYNASSVNLLEGESVAVNVEGDSDDIILGYHDNPDGTNWGVAVLIALAFVGTVGFWVGYVPMWLSSQFSEGLATLYLVLITIVLIGAMSNAGE